MISEFPLFVFTTLGGLAAGAYAASAVFPVGKDAKKPWLFPLVCLILLAVGLLCLPAHLGRPERMLAALTHPSAMIAQEAYWSCGLGVVILIDLILSFKKGSAPRALRIVGAVAAIGLVVVMANAYYVSAAIPAWATWQTFLLYLLGDAAMGVALLAVFQEDLVAKRPYGITVAASGILAALAFVLEAAHFAGVGLSMIPFVVAAVLAVAGAAVVLLAGKGKIPAKTAAWATFLCMLIAAVIARYSFYAACVL